MKNILILAFASLLSSGLLANDQQVEIDSIKDFVGTNRPMLFEGKDEIGECRIMIYSAITNEISNIWFEGTFQNESGPVAGVLFPVLVSSNPEVAQIKDFSINIQTLFLKMIYPGQPGYSMLLKKSVEGEFSTVTFKVGNITRKCLNLKQLL